MTRLVVRGRLLALAIAFAASTVAGCALTGGTLGGREKCWPESPPRGASVWRGVLVIDATATQLQTPEGEVIPLLPGALTTRIGTNGMGELVAGDRVEAKAGQDVDLFGGMGADGALVVCAVEEIH